VQSLTEGGEPAFAAHWARPTGSERITGCDRRGRTAVVGASSRASTTGRRAPRSWPETHARDVGLGYEEPSDAEGPTGAMPAGPPLERIVKGRDSLCSTDYREVVDAIATNSNPRPAPVKLPDPRHL